MRSYYLTANILFTFKYTDQIMMDVVEEVLFIHLVSSHVIYACLKDPTIRPEIRYYISQLKQR